MKHQNQDVPDEVWLKCFIEDYRRQCKNLETLERYTKSLEDYVKRLTTQYGVLEKEHKKIMSHIEDAMQTTGTGNPNHLWKYIQDNIDHLSKEQERSEKIRELNSKLHRLIHYCMEGGFPVPKKFVMND